VARLVAGVQPPSKFGGKGCERKVRAAQGAPLLKMEAVGDSWCRKKKITAHSKGKGEKVV